MDKKKSSSLKSGKPLEQRSSRVTIPQSVQKMSRCATLPYGLGMWWCLFKGWTLTISKVFSNLKDSMILSFHLKTILPGHNLPQGHSAAPPSENSSGTITVDGYKTAHRLQKPSWNLPETKADVHKHHLAGKRTHAWPQSYFHQKYFDLQWVP